MENDEVKVSNEEIEVTDGDDEEGKSKMIKKKTELKWAGINSTLNEEITMKKKEEERKKKNEKKKKKNNKKKKEKKKNHNKKKEKEKMRE